MTDSHISDLARAARMATRDGLEYAMMSKWLSTTSMDCAVCRDIGLLLIRLFFGGALAMMHGFGKLPVSDEFVSGVSEMGFPLPALFAWSVWAG